MKSKYFEGSPFFFLRIYASDLFYYFFFVFEAYFAEDFAFCAVCDAAFDFAVVFAGKLQ